MLMKRKKDFFQWGVGQPSLIHFGNGIVALFYTEGTWYKTSTKCALYNLSDLNNIVWYETVTVSNTGLLQHNGSEDFLSNGDFAIDNDTLYVVCDVHPFGEGILSCVPVVSRVYMTDIDVNTFMDDLASCEWKVVKDLQEADRTHNNGFVRNPNGCLHENVVISTIGYEKTNFSESLYTYRLAKSEIN